MRVAVTGVASRGGAEIARWLEAAGHSVKAGVYLRSRHESGSAGQEDCPTAECLRFGALRADMLGSHFADVDAAVLILPKDKMILPLASHLVRAAERAHVDRLVLISFLHADTGIGGPMLRWHFDAEQVARGSRIPTTCLRPNFYMQDFIGPFRPSPELNLGLISYVDARDVAEAVHAVLSQAGVGTSTYSLTGPRAYTAEEVMRILEGEVGPPVSPPSTSWDHVCSSSRRSAHSVEIQALCEMWQAATEGRFATVTPDVEQIIGRPARTLERFARDHHGQCRRVVSIPGGSRRCA